MGEVTIFDFSPDVPWNEWRIVNDGVMGGLSSGQFLITDQGHGCFRGTVSLENNGGFSMVRYRMDEYPVDAFQSIAIRCKGDGKRYQFRLKSNRNEVHSYVSTLETSGDWETIEIPFELFQPQFRGRRLNMSKFPGETIGEIGILCGNKRAETFRLEIDWIKLKR